MIQSIKSTLAKRAFKKLEPAKLDCSNFSESARKIQQIAIVYPHKSEQTNEADNVLKQLFDYFPKAEFTMIKPYDLTKEKQDFSGLPNDLFFSDYTNKTYDMAIDLSDSFNLAASFIIAKLAARMNVRFYSDEESDSIFHFSFINQNNSLHDSVAQFLNSFKIIVQSNLLRKSVSN